MTHPGIIIDFINLIIMVVNQYLVQYSNGVGLEQFSSHMVDNLMLDNLIRKVFKRFPLIFFIYSYINLSYSIYYVHLYVHVSYLQLKNGEVNNISD